MISAIDTKRNSYISNIAYMLGESLSVQDIEDIISRKPGSYSNHLANYITGINAQLNEVSKRIGPLGMDELDRARLTTKGAELAAALIYRVSWDPIAPVTALSSATILTRNEGFSGYIMLPKSCLPHTQNTNDDDCELKKVVLSADCEEDVVRYLVGKIVEWNDPDFKE